MHKKGASGFFPPTPNIVEPKNCVGGGGNIHELMTRTYVESFKLFMH